MKNDELILDNFLLKGINKQANTSHFVCIRYGCFLALSLTFVFDLPELSTGAYSVFYLPSQQVFSQHCIPTAMARSKKSTNQTRTLRRNTSSSLILSSWSCCGIRPAFSLIVLIWSSSFAICSLPSAGLTGIDNSVPGIGEIHVYWSPSAVLNTFTHSESSTIKPIPFKLLVSKSV